MKNYNIFRTLPMFLSPCTGHLWKIISTKLKMTIVCMGTGGCPMLIWGTPLLSVRIKTKELGLAIKGLFYFSDSFTGQ